jgi:hypothetical protein
VGIYASKQCKLDNEQRLDATEGLWDTQPLESVRITVISPESFDDFDLSGTYARLMTIDTHDNTATVFYTNRTVARVGP